MSLLKSKKDKALERLWYEKLREQGFEDCENTRLPNRPLKEWHSFSRPMVDSEKREAASRYYRLAEELSHTYDFEKEIYKRIWDLHSKGLSRREIEKELKKSRFKKKLRQRRIQYIINKIAKEIL